MDISKCMCPGCGQPMRIARTHCPDCGVSLDGEFEISTLARLPLQDQIFVIAFVRHHGSLKKMEELFDISYPTVKNRLNAITAQLDRGVLAPSPNGEILDQVARGEIDVEEALRRMS